MAHKLSPASAARRAARAGSASSSSDLESMSVPQLRALAKDRGLSAKGNKAALVERLSA